MWTLTGWPGSIRPPTPPLPWPADTVGIIGTGGIYATASDLAAFGGLFTEADLLTQTSLDAMGQPGVSKWSVAGGQRG